MAEAVIEVRGLRKRYGELEAVRGIDLRIERGEIFALLGPNGAGKTTTVEILEGHRSRSAGEVSVLGFDPGRNEVAIKERMGIVLQHTGLEPYLTVSETVDMFRGFYPRPLPLDEVLEVVGLEEQRDQRVRRLSGGQQRRLDVAASLVLTGRAKIKYYEAGMDLGLASSTRESFRIFQGRIAQEYERMVVEYGFTRIDASQAIELQQEQVRRIVASHFDIADFKWPRDMARPVGQYLPVAL